LSAPPDQDHAPPRTVRWWECFRSALWLGLTSFGGPAAHIGYFERAYVQRLRWLDSTSFAQLTALCQVLPGPASSQMNFLIGWLRAGALGALLSFIAFTLPSALLMVAAAAYAGALGGVDTLVYALKLVAAVIVAQAVLSMARTLCPDIARRLLAIFCAAVCALLGGIYIQLAVIALGAVFGLRRGAPAKVATDTEAILPPVIAQKTAWRALVLFVLLLAALPVFALLTGHQGILPLAEVFYRSGALVFGGGHVVLPLLYDALPAARGDMVMFYGLAQALPGPLFAIAAALGYTLFSAAPWVGALAALGFIFLPGLLLAVAGYYFWQKILAMPRFMAAISGISAAVVGILAGALIDPVLTGAIRSLPDAGFLVACFALAVWKNLPAPAVMVLCGTYALLMGIWA
jgi:chromate transporter